MSRNADLVALMLRDGMVCYLCGSGPIDDDPWEVEHVVPKCRGGSDDLNNKKLAHRWCNNEKSDHPVAA